MTPADTAPSPTRRRYRYVVLVVLGLILVAGGGLFVGSQLYRRYVHDRLLREAIAEVEATDPHWRIEAIEAQRAVIPDAENSASIIRSARATFGRPNQADYSQRIRPLETLPPEVRLTDEQYRDITELLEKVEEAGTAALTLADYPRGRHPINYAPDGISTLIPHVDDLTVLHWRVLQLLLLARIHEGNTAAALRACRATLNLGRSLGDEPFVVSQLVRQKFHAQAIRGLMRLLGQGEVPEVELAAFQPALAEEAAFDPWALAVRGERAMVFQALEAVQNGQLKPRMIRAMTSAPRTPVTPLDEVRTWLHDRFPPDTRPDEAWALRHYTRLLEMAALAWPQRQAAAEALAAERSAVPELARDILWNPHKHVEHFHSAHARGQCGVVAVAIERYRLRRGAWPDSLAALVPDLLPTVPLDPFDGQPLRYRRLADGVVIYSIGPDSADDGGKLAEGSPPAPGTDLGLRLWDVPHRRQPPPPVPPESPR
jgi:hypothetical protein